MKILAPFVFITSILLIPLCASANEASATPTSMTAVQFTSDTDTNIQTTQLQPLVKISNQSELTFLKTIDLSPHLIPVGITYDPSTGNTYVANSADHTISVIDGHTNRIIDNISLTNGTNNFGFSGPIGLAFDHHNHSVYAVNAPGGMVSIINAETHKVTNTIDLGGNLSWIAINLKEKQVYVLDSDASIIYVISTKTQKIIDTIHTEGSPWSIAYNTNDGNLYAPILGANSVQVIDGKTHKVTNTLNLGDQGSPRFIAFDYNNNHAYVTCGTGKVVVIDTPSTKVIGEITIPDLPYGGYYNKTGQFTVYDNYSDVIHSSREKLAGNPADIVFNPDNGYMYVVDYAVGVLNVIDTKNMTLVNNMATPPSSYGIVYNEKNKTIYMSNASLDSVSLIGNVG